MFFIIYLSMIVSKIRWFGSLKLNWIIILTSKKRNFSSRRDRHAKVYEKFSGPRFFWGGS